MRKLLSILICVAWILTSCTPAAHADNPDFTSFTDQLFIQQMNEDALSANYTLDVSLRHAMKDKNYLYYHQYLGPTTGVQAQLPVLLSEFHLNNKAQFNTYFSLLKSIPAYFQSIVDYEIAKTEHHLSASASSLTRIIEQCHEFAQNPEKNVLITNFNHRLKEMTFLSIEEKKAYRQTNKQLILETILFLPMRKWFHSSKDCSPTQEPMAALPHLRMENLITLISSNPLWEHYVVFPILSR